MLQVFVLAHLDRAFWLPGLLESPPNLRTVWAGMAVAFGFGAVHALSPGHGKTLVSAYLIGTKGTPGQALLLGVMTTITHTLSVFALGLIALFASQYLLPEQLYPVLGSLSGLIVCVVGFRLLQNRLSQSHHHHHSHHEHHHGSHSHTHSHGDLPSLVTLGISGGLVPCPSALVLLLSAVALHQITYGLVLVGGFSLGLASVLIMLGLIAVYARQWLEQLPVADRWVQHLSLVSAIAVICIGIGLTAFSILSRSSSINSEFLF